MSIALLARVAAGETTITSFPVQGAVVTRWDIGQSFLAPSTSERILQSFTVRAKPTNYDSLEDDRTVTFRFHLFRFDGERVIGAPLYSSAPRTLVAGTQLADVTFAPQVELAPGANHLAVYALSEFHPPSGTHALYFDANTIQGEPDRYTDGSMRWMLPPGLFPYEGLTWSTPSPAHNDLGFTAAFVLPEAVLHNWFWLFTVAIAHRRRAA